MVETLGPIFHQIINTDPRSGYDGRPVIDATKLPAGHVPAKMVNNKNRDRDGR